MNTCPNCQSQIKDNIFKKNPLLDEDRTKFINNFTDQKSINYCLSCGESIFYTAKRNFAKMKKEVIASFKDHVSSFPALSIPHPATWEYEIINLVSRSVSIESTITDLSGIENKILYKLKFDTSKLGGNAIIGLNIAYSFQNQNNFGNSNIINLYGTAVNVKNTDVFPEQFHSSKKVYIDFEETRQLLNKFESTSKL